MTMALLPARRTRAVTGGPVAGAHACPNPGQDRRARLQSEERVDERGLAGAGAADHAAARARLHRHAQAVQHERQARPVAHLHVLELDLRARARRRSRGGLLARRRAARRRLGGAPRERSRPRAACARAPQAHVPPALEHRLPPCLTQALHTDCKDGRLSNMQPGG